MNIKYLTFVLSALAILTSCSSEQEEKIGDLKGNSTEVNTNDAPLLQNDAKNLNFSAYAYSGSAVAIGSGNIVEEPLNYQPKRDIKKIIKDGTIRIKASDIHESKKNIDGLLKSLGGYYQKEDLQNNERFSSYDLKIKVPAENFENLISGMERRKDEIQNKSIQAKDVTEEYVDIETRLINKREYLKRYKELLGKASTVNDILNIESYIRNLQEEIESKEGRLKFLNDQVTFSTLDVHLFNQKEFVYRAEPQDSFTERLKKSMSNGWMSVVDSMLWIVAIWPIIILSVISVYIFRRIRKARKKQV